MILQALVKHYETLADADKVTRTVDFLLADDVQ